MLTQIIAESSKQKKRSDANDKQEAIKMLNGLKREIDCIEGNLNNTTEPLLIDSYVFELKALHTRYQYYLKICKDKGIAAAAG